jgi:hypothetical protein
VHGTSSIAPPARRHVTVGTGDAPCLRVSVAARTCSAGPDRGAYTVDAAAVRHGACVERETADP